MSLQSSSCKYPVLWLVDSQGHRAFRIRESMIFAEGERPLILSGAGWGAADLIVLMTESLEDKKRQPSIVSLVLMNVIGLVFHSICFVMH